MDLLMAHRAVLESRRAQIVKRRRHHADGPASCSPWADSRGTPDTPAAPPAASACGDSPIHAAHGTLPQPSNRTGACSNVNGPRLSPWQLKHPGSLAPNDLRHRRTHAAVRIVAIDTAHGAFGQLVVIRLLELRPHIRVATGALFVDRCRACATDQAMAAVGVNLVAGACRRPDPSRGCFASRPTCVG